MYDSFSKSAVELANLIRNGYLSPVELLKATLAGIEAVNPSLNAFVEQAVKAFEDMGHSVEI